MLSPRREAALHPAMAGRAALLDRDCSMSDVIEAARVVKRGGACGEAAGLADEAGPAPGA
jgi:hypothetical protein